MCSSDLILEDLPPKAKVLDVGCGTGNPIAKHIVACGFRVVGVDQSKEMLKIAAVLNIFQIIGRSAASTHITIRIPRDENPIDQRFYRIFSIFFETQSDSC